MQTEFFSTYRVYIEDTDAGGVVYYVNYLKFMERSRTDLLRTLGFPKPALISDDLAVVVSSAAIDYKKSALLDDEILVTANPVTIARSYIVFEQQVFRSESEEPPILLAKGNIKIACVKRDSMRPTAFPKPLVSALQQHIKITTPEEQR